MKTYQVVAAQPRTMDCRPRQIALPADRVCSEWTSRANAERNATANKRRFGGEYTVVEVSHE